MPSSALATPYSKSARTTASTTVSMVIQVSPLPILRCFHVSRLWCARYLLASYHTASRNTPINPQAMTKSNSIILLPPMPTSPSCLMPYQLSQDTGVHCQPQQISPRGVGGDPKQLSAFRAWPYPTTDPDFLLAIRANFDLNSHLYLPNHGGLA